MSDAPGSSAPLISIRFENGADGPATFTYHLDYSVEVTGRLWPRQLRAVDAMLQAYKLCTRGDSPYDNADRSSDAK